MALLIARLAKADFVFGSIDVFSLKCFRAHTNEFRGTLHVFFGEINVPILIAAANAAGLAGEANIVHVFNRCV